MTSLIEEAKSSDDIKVGRTFHSDNRSRRSQSRGGNSNNNSSRKERSRRSGNKFCCLCRASNRPDWDSHYLSTCKYVPDADRQAFSKIRNIEVVESDEVSESSPSASEESARSEEEAQTDVDDDPSPVTAAVTRRVTVRKSPTLQCFYKHHPVSVCLDTGSESNFISVSCVEELDLVVSDSKQGAVQADKKAQLKVLGEVNFDLVRGPHTFVCNALVVQEELGDVVGGEPFLETNDIYVRSSKKEIHIRDSETISYAKSS